jgi:hypothetical protein
MVRQLPNDQFETKGRRFIYGRPENTRAARTIGSANAYFAKIKLLVESRTC